MESFDESFNYTGAQCALNDREKQNVLAVDHIPHRKNDLKNMYEIAFKHLISDFPKPIDDGKNDTGQAFLT
jgi:hypothetical protein